MNRPPSMSRMHYAFIAEILAEQRAHHLDNDSPSMVAAVEMVAETFARELKRTNPRYSAERFRAACGVTA